MPVLRDWNFDAIITHNRFTLVNRNAEEMMDYAHEKGIAIFNAAPYSGGVFAKGAASHKSYVYQDASPEMLAPIVRIEQVWCKARPSTRCCGPAVLEAGSAGDANDFAESASRNVSSRRSIGPVSPFRKRFGMS